MAKQFTTILQLSFITIIFLINYIYAKPTTDPVLGNLIKQIEKQYPSGHKHGNSDDEQLKEQFIVFGDWGRNGLENQTECARGMNKWCSRNKCEFIISTGDNFYPSGVRTVEDDHWKETFESIYRDENKTPYLKDVPFYAIMGNHDYYQYPKAQIYYSEVNRGKTTWRVPDYYYTFSNEKKDKDSTQQGNVSLRTKFIMIDTTPMLSNYYNETHRNVNHTHVREREPTEQYRWFRNELRKNDDGQAIDWSFVVGHHPAYTTRIYEKDPLLDNIIKPMVESKASRIFFCGHDHFISTGTDRNGIYQLISGAGSRLRPLAYNGLNNFWGLSDSSFMYVTVYKSRVIIQIIDKDAIVHRSIVVTK